MIAIISILVAIATVQYLASVRIAKVKEAMATLSTIRTAEGVYHNKFLEYGDFTELAETIEVIDDRFAGGGTGPVEVNRITYLFTLGPEEDEYEITATTVYGSVIKLAIDGRIIIVQD